MRLSKARKKRSIVGLTSLIDVIFLLLLFFMLSSTFSQYSQLDLGVSGAGSAGGSMPKLIIALSDDGIVRLNGQPSSPSELELALEPFLLKGVKTAVVVPRGDVKLQKLVDLLERLKHSKLEAVSLSN